MTSTSTINNELAIFNKAIQNKKSIAKTDIQRLLDVYRKVFNVDAVYILEVVPTNNALVITYISASKEISRQLNFYIGFLNKKFKSLRKKFDQESLCTDADLNHDENDFKSLLQYGAFRTGYLDGCIGMVDFHKKRTWTKSERSALLKLGRTLHYIIIDSRQTKLIKEHEKQLKIEQTQTHVLRSMAEIYLTVHLIDLKTDTSVEFTSFFYAQKFTSKSKKASEQIELAIFNNTSPEYQPVLKKFIDFSTLERRMGNKKSVYLDFYGIHFGWIRGQFIASEFDEHNHLAKVVFTTQVINEEKLKEEHLVRISNTDELTQVKNRRCYDADIKEFSKKPLPDDFVLVSFDLNSLKVTNDEKGHAAGDELLQGVTQCISQSFGSIGKIYRTGGDEFACLFIADAKKTNSMIKDFEDAQKKWKGNLNDKISISMGYARAGENKGKPIHELEKIADKMMYDHKKAYYEQKNNERRRFR